MKNNSMMHGSIPCIIFGVMRMRQRGEDEMEGHSANFFAPSETGSSLSGNLFAAFGSYCLA